MKLENLTIAQIVGLACSGDIDASEFGHRAIRFTQLAAKTSYTLDEANDLKNLQYVLVNNLANEAFVAHLVEVLYGPVEVINAL